MKFKLDEDIGQRGLRILKDAGHDVATVRGQSLDGAEDGDLIEVCRDEQRALTTESIEGRLWIVEIGRIRVHQDADPN